MVEDLLPIGTTNSYIALLNRKQIEVSVFTELRENYSRLTWNVDIRKYFLEALINACSNFIKEGWIFRTERVSEQTIEALKTLKDFLLIDPPLMLILHNRPDLAVKLRLDKHLQDETSRNIALELAQFLTKSKSIYLQNYVDYILTIEGRDLVTKYLQKKDSEEERPKKRALTTESDSDSDNDNGGEGSSKFAKTEDAVWSWQEDEHTWVDYTVEVSAKIEKAYKKKQKTSKVDKQRFIDFENMLQRRYDDTTKRRAIKRQLKSDILESN